MSRTELHYGRFQVVAKGINEMKQYAKENGLENKLEFDEYDENRCYCFIETSDVYEAVYVNGEWQLIKYLKHIETDDEEYISHIVKTDDDIYDFVMMFYNGGTCLAEVIGDALAEKNKE